MFRLLAAIFALNFIFLLTDGIYEGGGGVQTTILDGDLSAVAVIITVDSTDGFADADKTVRIGTEDVFYTGTGATTFTGCVRGYNDTIAVTHDDGDLLYDRGAGLVNELMDYDITTTAVTGEVEASVVSEVESFWGDTIPTMFLWDYGFFNGELAIIRYFLMAICGLLTAIIAMNMIPFINFG